MLISSLIPDHAPRMYAHLVLHTSVRVGIEITHFVNIWESDLQPRYLLLLGEFCQPVWSEHLKKGSCQQDLGPGYLGD